MSKSRSRTVQVLDLIEKYINLLDACNMSECYLMNDKLIDILHRRFFDELSRITGEPFQPKKKNSDFSIVLQSCCTLFADGNPINLGYWDDTYIYFIEENTSLFGYQMNFSSQSLKTFKSSFLYYNDAAKSFEDFFLKVEQDLDISDLMGVSEFYETMRNVYICFENYSIDTQVYMNEMIPAARRCYMQHRNCQLFKKMFSYLNSFSSLHTDNLFACYETEQCWYSVFYYGMYNDWDQGWYFQLPANLYLKRLYIDISLQELNRRYQFYSQEERKTTRKES